jgi:hypothetical protein
MIRATVADLGGKFVTCIIKVSLLVLLTQFSLEVAVSPWHIGHRLVQTRVVRGGPATPSNLVRRGIATLC